MLQAHRYFLLRDDAYAIHTTHADGGQATALDGFERVFCNNEEQIMHENRTKGATLCHFQAMLAGVITDRLALRSTIDWGTRVRQNNRSPMNRTDLK